MLLQSWLFQPLPGKLLRKPEDEEETETEPVIFTWKIRKPKLVQQYLTWFTDSNPIFRIVFYLNKDFKIMIMYLKEFFVPTRIKIILTIIATILFYLTSGVFFRIGIFGNIPITIFFFLNFPITLIYDYVFVNFFHIQFIYLALVLVIFWWYVLSCLIFAIYKKFGGKAN